MRAPAALYTTPSLLTCRVALPTARAGSAHSTAVADSQRADAATAAVEASPLPDPPRPTRQDSAAVFRKPAPVTVTVTAAAAGAALGIALTTTTGSSNQNASPLSDVALPPSPSSMATSRDAAPAPPPRSGDCSGTAHCTRIKLPPLRAAKAPVVLDALPHAQLADTTTASSPSALASTSTVTSCCDELGQP